MVFSFPISSSVLPLLFFFFINGITLPSTVNGSPCVPSFSLSTSSVGQPSSIIGAQDGLKVFVTFPAVQKVGVYSRDRVTGALTILTQITYATETPYSVVVTKDNQNLYVLASGSLFSYSLDSAGFPTQIDSFVVPNAATSTKSLVLAPDGAFLYVVSTTLLDGVYSFSRDIFTGLLSTSASYGGLLVSSLTISPDGTVYAMATLGISLVTGSRDPVTGTLNPAATTLPLSLLDVEVAINSDNVAVFTGLASALLGEPSAYIIDILGVSTVLSSSLIGTLLTSYGDILFNECSNQLYVATSLLGAGGIEIYTLTGSGASTVFSPYLGMPLPTIPGVGSGGSMWGSPDSAFLYKADPSASQIHIISNCLSSCGFVYPSITPTSSCTASLTASPSLSVSSSLTASSSLTSSSSTSISPSESSSLSSSASLSPSHSITFSQSLSASPSLSSSSTHTITPSLSPSISPSISTSLTASGSQSISSSVSLSASSSVTVTPSTSASVSGTPSTSQSTTLTPSFSPTSSPTSSLTASPTPSAPSSSTTNTPSLSSSSTLSPEGSTSVSSSTTLNSVISSSVSKTGVVSEGPITKSLSPTLTRTRTRTRTRSRTQQLSPSPDPDHYSIEPCLRSDNCSIEAPVIPADHLIKNSSQPLVVPIHSKGDEKVVVGKVIVPAGVLPAGCFLTVRQGENPEVKKAETTCKCEGEDVQTDAPVQVSSVIVELSLAGHCPGLDKENPSFDEPIRLELLGLKKSYSGQPYCFGFWKEGSRNKKDNQWSCLSEEVEVLGEEQGIVERKGERTNGNLLTYRVRTSHFTSFAVLLFGTVDLDTVCGTSDILWILSVSFIGAAITLFLCVSTLYAYNYRFRAFVGGHVGHSINNTTKLVRRVTMTSLQRGGSTSGIGVSLLQLGPSISPITPRVD